MTDAVIAGERVTLLPEKAVFWHAQQTLFVADPHFGKAASFRKLGVFVPGGTTLEGLARLDRMIAQCGARTVTFLGDFLHAEEGRNERTFSALTEWRARHGDVQMELVRGNHDKRAGDPPNEVGITCVDGPVLRGPFALAHHPVPVADHYVLAGHIHPCVVLIGRGRQRERLCCFHFGENVGVLPAFGDFTGCAEVSLDPMDQVWVIAGDDVVRMSPATAEKP